MKRRVLGLLWIGLLAAASGGTARADVVPGPLIVSGPVGKSVGFLTPVAVTEKGGPLTYLNVDIEQHNVVSCHFAGGKKVCDYGPDDQAWCFLYDAGKCPLFWSPLLSAAGSVQVGGLENVEPGKTYGFYCEPHGSAMTGTIVVLPE